MHTEILLADLLRVKMLSAGLGLALCIDLPHWTHLNYGDLDQYSSLSLIYQPCFSSLSIGMRLSNHGCGDRDVSEFNGALH